MDLEYLIKEAEKYNGCSNGLEQLENCKTVEALIQCYFDRIDYCLANNFPTNDYLKLYRDELESKGVFIDKKTGKLDSDNNTIVILGNSICTLVFGGYSVKRIYVKHGSKINIKASGNAFVMVDALDNSDVVVDVKDDAKIIVNLYSKATCAGATKIIQKNKQTYDL